MAELFQGEVCGSATVEQVAAAHGPLKWAFVFVCVLQGVVRSIKPYGAFVDIGGITGLLHISQISHDHITDVTKVLKEGQEISAMILTQDKEKVPPRHTRALACALEWSKVRQGQLLSCVSSRAVGMRQ